MATPKPNRQGILPRALPPIGLSREESATFIGVSPTLFDELVRDGRMPRPKHINTRRIWSRVAIEKAFAALPGDEEEDDEWEVS